MPSLPTFAQERVQNLRARYRGRRPLIAGGIIVGSIVLGLYQAVNAWSVAEFAADKIGNERLHSAVDAVGSKGDWVYSHGLLAPVIALVGVVWLIGIGLFSKPIYVTSAQSEKGSKGRPWIVSDNVRWEDNGDFVNDGMRVVGPLCPADLTYLRKREGNATRSLRTTDYAGEGNTFLCLTCNENYEFSTTKSLEVARDEAENVLHGMRNRARVAE